MIEENFEYQLIEATQPIRYYALAVAIYHIFQEGIYDKLLESPLSLETLAQNLNLESTKLLGFLRYLTNEGIIEFVGGKIRLAPKGLQLNKFRSWYTFFIGGYGNTFLQIGEKLKSGSGWAERNTRSVGIGSCGISHFDAIPLTYSLILEMPKKCNCILDVGCGNALYLVEFCKFVPDIKAWGIERDQGAYQAAIELVCQEGLEDRITISNTSALELIESPLDYEPDLVVIGFMLQEILSQDGEQGVIKFLTEIVNKFPEVYIVVIEVDQQISNKKIMAHGLSLAYYNPYYLIHYFTNQRLETPEFWEKIFEQCNLEVKAKQSTQINVDSTGLEIGYFLKLRSN